MLHPHRYANILKTAAFVLNSFETKGWTKQWHNGKKEVVDEWRFAKKKKTTFLSKTYFVG